MHQICGHWPIYKMATAFCSTHSNRQKSLPCLVSFPRKKEVYQTYLHAHWLELHHMTLSQLLARVMGSPCLACLKQDWPLGWGWSQLPQLIRQHGESVEVWTKSREAGKSGWILGRQSIF